MPLDGHSYLKGQGWAGQGAGLRHNAISRPLAIAQKKTLAGLGKDRDEAFPFWDHLFNAGAKTIQVKLHKDEEDGTSDSDEPQDRPTFLRTSTGLISNKRPLLGTPASSGTSTPFSSDTPQRSLIATAKRESARKGLYARFFRGPVLGPEVLEEVDLASTSTPSLVGLSSNTVVSQTLEIVIDSESSAMEPAGSSLTKTKKDKRKKERGLSKEERRAKKEKRKSRHRTEQNVEELPEDVEVLEGKGSAKSSKKRKREIDDNAANSLKKERREKKKKKKRRKDTECVAGDEEDMVSEVKRKEEKKRRKKEKKMDKLKDENPS